MTYTLDDLTRDVIALIPETTELVFVNYDDQLTDEQVNLIVSGDIESLWESLWDFESEARVHGVTYLLDDLKTEAVNAAYRTGQIDEDQADELRQQWSDSDGWWEAREIAEERESGEWFLQLANQTPDVLLRMTVVDEDNCWSFEGIEPEEMLAKVGLPESDANLAAARECISEASPEYSVCLVYALASASVRDLLRMEQDSTVKVTNPELWLGSPFTGAGWVAQFEGELTFDALEIRTDKGAFGYGWQEVVGQQWSNDAQVEVLA